VSLSVAAWSNTLAGQSGFLEQTIALLPVRSACGIFHALPSNAADALTPIGIVVAFARSRKPIHASRRRRGAAAAVRARRLPAARARRRLLRTTPVSIAAIQPRGFAILRAYWPVNLSRPQGHRGWRAKAMLSLVGQYGSPFVRRVAASLTVLELPFERQPLSVFADAEALRSRNPLGRVPALLIEDGECLIDKCGDPRSSRRARGPAAGVAAGGGSGAPRRPEDGRAGHRHLRQDGSHPLRKATRGQQARPRLDRALPRANRGWPWRTRPSFGAPNLAAATAAAASDQCCRHAGLYSAVFAGGGAGWPLSRLGPAVRLGGGATRVHSLPALHCRAWRPPEVARAALLRLQGSAQSR